VLSVFGRRIKGMIRLRPEQVWTCNETLRVHTFSGRNRIIPLMRRPNTDSTPKKPVTLPRKQTFDTLRVHESRPHCHDTVLRYAVTVQVCTHPNGVHSQMQRFKKHKNVGVYIIDFWKMYHYLIRIWQ
jgi:hypothetical protein